MKIFSLLLALTSFSTAAMAEEIKINTNDPIAIFFVDSVRSQCPAEFQKIRQLSGQENLQVLTSSTQFPNGSVAIKIKVDTSLGTAILIKQYAGLEVSQPARCVLNIKGSASGIN